MAGSRECPSCHAAMASGWLSAESITAGARWHATRPKLGLGGEKVGEYRWDGMALFEGFRCPACRLLLLSY